MDFNGPKTRRARPTRKAFLLENNERARLEAVRLGVRPRGGLVAAQNYVLRRPAREIKAHERHEACDGGIAGLIVFISGVRARARLASAVRAHLVGSTRELDAKRRARVIGLTVKSVVER